MLEAISSEDSPGFSKYAMNNVKLMEGGRTTGSDGKSVQSVLKIRLEVSEKMSNQMGNLHGEFFESNRRGTGG